MFESIFQHTKIIPWNKFFNIVEDPIVHYRIIPDKTVQNNTIVLSRAFHELYSAPKDRIQIDIRGIKLTYRIKEKVFFDIIFQPGQAHFYLSTHQRWAKFLEAKMKNIWDKCAIAVVERPELSTFDIENCAACDVRLRKHNIFSLKTSTKDLDPLNSMFAVLKDLSEEDNEKVRVSFIFEAIDRIDWQQSAEDAYRNYQKGAMPRRMQVTREDVFQKVFKSAEIALGWYIELRMMIIDGLIGFMGSTSDDGIQKDLQNNSIDTDVIRQNAQGGLSRSTIQKLKAATFNTHIRIVSQSNNQNNRLINMRTVANAFKDLNGDNELQTVELPEKKQQSRVNEVLNFKAPFRLDHDIFSDEEVAKCIQLPQITLQQQFNIQSIDTREIDLPEELKKGYIPIGTSRLKQKDFQAYWPDNKNIITLPKVLIGPMGAGKSEYIKNFCVAASRKGDSIIVFDYIKNCELSESISKEIDCIKLNLADPEQLFALAFPEVEHSDDTWGRLRAANLLSRQTEFLLNSVVDDTTGPLTAPMIRYLNAACMAVFIQPGKTVDDVFKCLRNWQSRNEYIRLAKYSKCFAEDDEIFFDLNELHDRATDGKIIGTREHLIVGVINRISVLSKDIYIKRMLKAPINPDHNFCTWMNQGKAILIQMPERVFTNKSIKDTLVIYYTSRAWLAGLQRENGPIVHIVYDEIHQCPTTANMLSAIITEPRKFGFDFLFAVHYMKQFRTLHDSIKAAGLSYMLLSGTEKENLRSLEQELLPFTIEEAMNLKPFHSLNIINYGNQYSKFISKLPKPI